ncbi:hypothetical protein ACQ4PT_021139 [Festuca glaucescens]
MAGEDGGGVVGRAEARIHLLQPRGAGICLRFLEGDKMKFGWEATQPSTADVCNPCSSHTHLHALVCFARIDLKEEKGLKNLKKISSKLMVNLGSLTRTTKTMSRSHNDCSL